MATFRRHMIQPEDVVAHLEESAARRRILQHGRQLLLNSLGRELSPAFSQKDVLEDVYRMQQL